MRKRADLRFEISHFRVGPASLDSRERVSCLEATGPKKALTLALSDAMGEGRESKDERSSES